MLQCYILQLFCHNNGLYHQRTLYAVLTLRLVCNTAAALHSDANFTTFSAPLDEQEQWRTQEFCSVGVGIQQIQLRTEDRENGDLGAVSP